MLAKHYTVLALLAILNSATVAAAWENENLRNWDQGWSHNIFGEPLDPKVSCGGKSCAGPPLIKPILAPTRGNTNVCRSSSSGNHTFMCNDVPENATLVSNEEFAGLFPTPGEPKFPQAPPTNQTLQKRSRWELDITTGSPEMYMWKKGVPYTYSIVAAPGLSGEIAGVAAAIESSLRLWTESCGLENGSGYTDPFFNYWSYDPSASKANIWFYISPGTVCGKRDALACAFTPREYPDKRATVMINNELYKSAGRNEAILAMAHEMGHVLGLEHEEMDESRDIWVSSDIDHNSIMRPHAKDLSGITTLDCLAMDYYYERTPKPVSCEVHPTKGRVCTKVTIQTVSPQSLQFGSSKFLWEPRVGRDKLLRATNKECLGSDVSKYSVHITGDDNRFPLGRSFSQCSAIREHYRSDIFFALQSDGNFVSYSIGTGQAYRATNSAGRGTKGGYTIKFQLDGNLVIYDAMDKATWSSGTYIGSSQTFGFKPAYWWFNYGDFFIQDSSHRNLWGTKSTTVLGHISLQQKGTKYCLDARDNTSGTKTALYKCNGSDKQVWDIFTDGSVVNSASRLCLDNYDRRTNSGNPIIVFHCSHEDNQRWRFLPDGTIKSHQVNKCIDNYNKALVNRNKIQMWDCHAGEAQKWVVVPVERTGIPIVVKD